jgi:uncharacterized protein (UPF0335 family)
MVCGFIPDYDGISDDASGQLLHLFAVPQLPWRRCGRKVDKSHAASCAPSALAAAGGKTVTSRLRELIQQLGEAIHESVIESEQIAGVVQDIRKHGFDVLLMLEATIGLNEVGSKESTDEESVATGEGEFTQNDLNFLKSLRISVEGGGDEEEPEE